MNVRVNLNYPIYDGAEIVFKAPCDASEVTGLIVYYPGDAGVVSSEFAFADAHANDLGNIDALFAAGAVVKVIIDTDTNMAFVQNAVTNAYLEERFAGIGGSGGTVDLRNYYTKAEVNQRISNSLGSLRTGLQEHDERIAALEASGSTVDLSNYYTKDELDAGTEEMLKGLVSTNLLSEELAVRDERIASVEASIGNISTALDSIIAMQEELIGGESA